MDLRALARETERTADRLERHVEAAVENTLADLLEAAQRATGGPLTEADLRRLGHPYARRRLRLNPDIVNRQTGELQAGWRTEGPSAKDGAVVGRLWNEADHAPLLEQEDGTGGAMAPRRPHERAAEEVQPRFETRIETALERIG